MSATWDPKKAQANFRKHGVRFSDAEAALMDPNGISREDPTADDERRFVAIGLDAVGRVVVVVYTYHGEDGEDVRMISARPATANERRQYEKGIRFQQGQTRSGDATTRKDTHHDPHRRRGTRGLPRTGRRGRPRVPDDDQ